LIDSTGSLTVAARKFLPILLVSTLHANSLPLMPLPSHVALGAGSLAIGKDFQIGVCGGNPAIARAAERFHARLEQVTGIILSQPLESKDCTGATLVLHPPTLDNQDESYQLQVTSTAAQLTAPSRLGILRGLATFEQLVQAGEHSFVVPSVTIDDHPRFPWRGFMLDCSRHWMPPEVVERNIEAMALVKLNVFHWHLTDDQGFRVESRLYPKLAGMGSDGHFYTQAEIRHIVAFAGERGIRVVPEFDVPGHASSWVTGYPELASAPGPYHIERQWGVFQPTLDPTREATFRFLDRFFGEMATLFPDPYVHIGGDEIDDTQWKANPAIQGFMRTHGLQTSKELHAYFNRRLLAILSSHGKKMIGWDEILTPDLPKSAVIQSWNGQKSLAEAAVQGYNGILSFGYYLDHLKSAAYHYANDPLGAEAASLTPDQSSHILGGEACMWTEYTSPQTVDSRIWPRLAVIAERLWSPADTRDEASMYARLEQISRKLEWTGVQHLTATDRLLTRISDDRPDPALKLLVDSVEAAGIHERYPSHKYDSLEPLNRLVDAALPESEWVRHLSEDANRVIETHGADLAAVTRLRVAFASWRDLPGKLAPIESESYLAAEAIPVAEILANLGQTGLEALDHLGDAPPSWPDTRKPVLDDAGKLTAELHIVAARPVRILVDGLKAPAPGQNRSSK
jgi:hexosaminidase